jgi:hypothetical protein
MTTKPTYEELELRVKELESEAVEHELAEKALLHRVEFNKLITTVSTKFIGLATDEIDQSINHALQEIGKFAD